MAKGPDEPLCCSRRAGAQGRLIVAGDNVENPMQAVLMAQRARPADGLRMPFPTHAPAPRCNSPTSLWQGFKAPCPPLLGR